MSNEEIVKEIDEATNLMTEAKVKMNVALNLARGVIMKGNTVDTEAYNNGLEDAWKLARKIVLDVSKGGIPERDMRSMFGEKWTVVDILENYTPQEALAKLEAYEKEQNEIKVGDVVFNKDTNEHCVITHIEGKLVVYCLYDDGSCGTSNIKECEKTGKNIDIQSLLEQIKE